MLICLLPALWLFSRDRKKKKLCRPAGVPMLFNINEILVFGFVGNAASAVMCTENKKSCKNKCFYSFFKEIQSICTLRMFCAFWRGSMPGSAETI